MSLSGGMVMSSAGGPTARRFCAARGSATTSEMRRAVRMRRRVMGSSVDETNTVILSRRSEAETAKDPLARAHSCRGSFAALRGSAAPTAQDDRCCILDVSGSEHLGGRQVEALVAADFLEAPDEVFGADAAALGAGVVGEDAALVHHHDAVAEGGGLLHGVGDHQRREAVLRDDAVGQPDDLVD